MLTGEDDIEKLGEIVSWNHENKTDAFTGECGKVRGSADGLFPPGITFITNTLSIFSTDLCRQLQFSKAGEQSMHGIPVTTFKLDSSNFANTSVCPDNECYQNNIPNGVQVFSTLKLLNTFVGVINFVECYSMQDEVTSIRVETSLPPG